MTRIGKRRVETGKLVIRSSVLPAPSAPRHQTLRKEEGRLRFRKRPHFDGDKPNSVSEFLRRMIIYLTPLARDARSRKCGSVMRRYPRINPERIRCVRTGCPPSVLSCTAWGFSCLANCFASGELLPRLFTLTCASLPKNRRCLFCDTFRHRALANAAPACFTRHAAVWCSDFPLANLAIHQRSSAIACNLA